MRFIMITQHNAWWHDASIHCDFDTLQNITKIIITANNIYYQIKNIFTNNFTIFTLVHIFLTWGKMPMTLKKVLM